jgi:aminotransferase
MINIHEPSITLLDKIRVFISLFSKQIGKDKKVDKFENELKKYLQIENLITTNSGTQALFEIFKVLKEKLYDCTNVLNPDKEIIISSMSYIGIASGIISNEFKIKYCDINENHLSIDLKNLKKVISKKTYAVVVQHYGGRPNYEIQEIADYLKKKQVYLIEDCATVLGAKINNRHLGSYGNFSIWSFDPNKSITSFDGGAIYCKDKKDYDKMKNNIYLGLNNSPTSYKDFVKNKDEWWVLNPVSYGSRNVLNEISATMGSSQLLRLDKIVNKHNKVWEYYYNNINNNLVSLPKHSNFNIEESGFLFWLYCDNRNNLAKYLKENKIYSTFRYFPLHKTELYKSNSYLPITEKVYDKIICIPCHKNLTSKDLKHIVSTINKFKG